MYLVHFRSLMTRVRLVREMYCTFLWHFILALVLVGLIFQLIRTSLVFLPSCLEFPLVQSRKENLKLTKLSTFEIVKWIYLQIKIGYFVGVVGSESSQNYIIE